MPKGVVADDRYSIHFSYFHIFFKIRNGRGRIRDRLEVNALRVLVDERRGFVGVGRIEEPRFDAQVREGVLELGIGAAVEF